MGTYNEGRQGFKGQKYLLSKECLEMILGLFKDLFYDRDWTDIQVHSFLCQGGPKALFGWGVDRADLVTVIRALMDQVKAKDEALQFLQVYLQTALITPAHVENGRKVKCQKSDTQPNDLTPAPFC